MGCVTMVAQQPPAGSAPGRRGIHGRWLAVGSAVWAVALVAVAVISFHRDPPTVREQRSIAQAAPVVDRAVGELVAAGQGADVALEITARRLEAGCRLTPSWTGATLERSLIVRVVSDAGPALLERVAERLPVAYRAAMRPNLDGTGDRLRADAGQFVAINGSVTAPGVVTLTARTGCRPQSPGFDPAADPRPAVGADGDARTALARMRAVGIERQATVAVPCPTGGGRLAWTDRASGRAVLGPEQRAALTGRAGAVVVVDTAAQLAVSTGTTSVVVRVDGARLDAASTTACAPV